MTLDDPRDRKRFLDKAYHAANKERRHAQSKAWRAANAEAKRARDKANYLANKERRLAQMKRWGRANADRRREISLTWQRNNPAKRTAAVAAWVKNNPVKAQAIANASTARRRARVLKATPPWVNHDEIRIIYQLASVLSMDVDHVHPLKGENFCGLHVPWNLQLLTTKANRSKSNKLLPEFV